MVTLVTDQQDMLSDCKLCPKMAAQCRSGGVYDINHDFSVRPVFSHSSVETRNLLFFLRPFQKGLLPLTGQRNRGHDDPDFKIRISLLQSFDRCKGENCFSGAGNYINNPAKVMLFPGSEAIFLPLIQFHVSFLPKFAVFVPVPAPSYRFPYILS